MKSQPGAGLYVTFAASLLFAMVLAVLVTRARPELAPIRDTSVHLDE